MADVNTFTICFYMFNSSNITKILIIFLILTTSFFGIEKVESASQWINIEISASQVPSDLTDFPVYVDLADLPSSFWTTTNCTDIRVFKSDGTTEVPREIVSCTDNGSSGTGDLHFLADGTLSSTATTTFQIHYDGSSSDYATDATYGAENVWSDYLGVYHLKDGSGTTVEDSTGNTDGTLTSSGLWSTGAPFGDTTAIQFDGTNYISASVLTDFDNITISQWQYITNAGGTKYIYGRQTDTTNRIVARYIDGTGFQAYERRIGGTKANTFAGTLNAWTHSVMTSQISGNLINYVNASVAVTPASTDSSDFNMGNQTMSFGALGSGASPLATGNYMSEIRLRTSVLSADWITTEYNNQSDTATFYDVSDEQTAGGDSDQPTGNAQILIDGGKFIIE